ncbi:MAG TPA: hypothetical protein VMY35_09900, partial [Phycisphaerae bacterium]|nr:hypothetical protein [Phycisphaerae bacterium]
MPATEAPPHARRELLRQKPRFLRADPARGLVAAVEPDASPVERQGGVPGEGLIRGMSMVTRGEALGHYEWLDDEFIGSVVESGQAAPKGVKSRFTHPSLSGDGLGSFLGRVRSARLSADGRKAIGDLHLSRAAHRSPDGDLGGYVMDLAVEDPEAFAVSIVYEPDYEAEEQHALEHGAFRDEDEWGPFLNFRDFTSPDPDNVKDLPHARLKRLFAADVVDDPAANPDGLFHREQQVAEDAEAVMSYALGLTDRSPEGVAFDVHPERVRGFVNRFMEARGLRIVKESVVSEPDETTTTETEEPAGTKPALDSPSRGRQGPEGQSAATAEQPAADQPAEEGSPN